MITKFKIFETINKGEPNVGDYVVVESNTIKYNMLVIGKIYSKSLPYYYVKYTIPDGHTFNDIIKYRDIKYWSKNKKELEVYINTQKYNL